MNSTLTSLWLFAGLAVVPDLAQAPPAPAQAVSTTMSATIPFSDVAFNPCTGEIIELSGNLHVVSHLTQDAAGGLHIQAEVNFQGVQGVALATGTTYRAVETSAFTFNTSGSPPLESTGVSTFQLVSQGAESSFLAQAVLHLTVNAGGEITANVANMSIECR